MMPAFARRAPALALVLLLACAGGDSDPATEADADADADTDSDTDADTDTDAVPFTIASPDFESSAGHPRADECDHWLPEQFTCSGSNPQIAWEGVPAGATHLVLVFDDPDAGDYPHWAIWDIPATETGLAAGISGEQVTNTPPAGASEAINGFQYEGYLGSCPGTVHKYRWRLWAVDQAMDAPPTGGPAAQFADVVAFAQANTVGEVTRMCHLYGPP